VYEGDSLEQGKEIILRKDESMETHNKDWEVIGSNTKSRRKKSNGRKKSISAKQAELDAMPVVPPLLVEAELLHQAKQQEISQTDEAPAALAPDGMAPILEEGAAHQRAKVLGLPDTTTEPPTPTVHLELQGEQAPIPQEALPVLQEGALHQRAKVLGLPDEHAQANLASQEPAFEQKEMMARSVFDEKQQDGPTQQQIIEDTLTSVPPVVTLHIPETFGEKFKAKLRERRNSLEEVGHNARLKMDAALERKFGCQAEKIQTELERARLTVISDAARMADMLQEHFSRCATDLKTQQQEAQIPKVELLDEKEIPQALLLGENVVAQKSLELQRSLQTSGHVVREKMDATIETKLGPKAAPFLQAGERLKAMAMEDTVETAEQIREQLTMAASSLREQLVHGTTPNYH